MLLVPICVAISAFVSGGKTGFVTTASLLSEMTDRYSLARLPATPFRQLQASSYDRTQTDPNDAKTWFNNADYGQFIRTETHGDHKEWVIMEHRGPGAITRIWTPLLAEKDKMVVRFYFDGADSPAIEEKFNDLMRGKGPIKLPFAFIAWPEPGVTDGIGADLYFPIPFAKGCKVTLSELPFYYSVDYRAYPAGTKVQTFSEADLQKLDPAIAAAGAHLGFAEPKDSKGWKEFGSVTLNPGDAWTPTVLQHAGAIDELEVDVPPDVSPQALRSTLVELGFDNEQLSWCPIGDFFGCGVSLKPVTDRYRQVTADGVMKCVWPMPYQHYAQVALRNASPDPVKVSLRFHVRPWKWDNRSVYFQADWRHQYPLPTMPRSDWNYLTVSGQGQYVGDTLTVMNPSPAWYGEGDERVYVDGEKFPSQLGTGTEDYYGYAWGMAEKFSSPFMAMPERARKGRDNWLGFITTSRVRGLDAIPFASAFKFDMEIWHWADCKEEYSAATFWYARPGADSFRKRGSIEASGLLPEVGGTIKGAIECEGLEVLSKSDNVQVSTQTGGLTDGYWSGGEQLFIQAHQVGDYVELTVPNRLAGKHKVALYATKSYDYGTVLFSVSGQAGQEVDLYSAKPVASGKIDLGTFELDGKDLILRIEVTGANAASRADRYYFGLDCLVVD